MFIKELFHSQVPNCRVGGVRLRLDGGNVGIEGEVINPTYI